jgi:hypothetical protein
MDACYRSARSKRWESVALELWRGAADAEGRRQGADFDQDHLLIKREMMPDGRAKLILKHKASGRVVERFE